MSRRGRSGPTISLFSFQDIITSVTAIVTVVTLLLALDLVQRKQSQANDSSTVLALEVVERLQQVEAELAQLQQASDTTDDLIRDVAATSPAELQADIEERERAIAALELERTRLRQLAESTATRRKLLLVEQFELEPSKQQTAKNETLIADLERQRSEEQAENRLIYAMPRGTTRTGWIIEIDGADLVVAPMGRAAKPRRFVSGLTLLGSSAVKQLMLWIDQQNLYSSYFLVLVRPNGTRSFEEVLDALEKKQITHGSDLIGDDQVLLHPERGAVP
ncbi:hypothetical protein [Schlesneria paludicola]|uniref:hypothetical protein n=1 Tax=Schlesneria paludicola TaxID=360056 RepID=UPI00029A9082|nr:hypothetical protein [Schlesneria paludicola]